MQPYLKFSIRDLTKLESQVAESIDPNYFGHPDRAPISFIKASLYFESGDKDGARCEITNGLSKYFLLADYPLEKFSKNELKQIKAFYDLRKKCSDNDSYQDKRLEEVNNLIASKPDEDEIDYLRHIANAACAELNDFSNNAVDSRLTSMASIFVNQHYRALELPFVREIIMKDGFLSPLDERRFLCHCNNNISSKPSTLLYPQEVAVELAEFTLQKLDEHFGCGTVFVDDLDNPGKTKNITSGLSLKEIKNPEKLKALIDTIRVLLDATDYKPEEKQFTGIGNKKYDVRVYNSDVSRLLRDNYTSKQFASVFKLCDSKGTFDLNVDKKTSLPKTADIDTSEVMEMAARTWVTDTCRNILLMKDKHPREIPRAITTVAKFYKNQEGSFKKIIDNPKVYTPYLGIEDNDSSFKYKGKIDAKVGIGHIFFPNTLNEDPKWFNRRRLESLGLFLQATCDSITEKIGNNGKWGFKSAKEVQQEVIDSLSYVARYLQAIDYAYAPSAGNWEETPFPGGLTWDTECIKEGFKKLKALMLNEKYDGNKEIEKIRKRLRASEFGSLLSNKAELERLIQRGEERVEKYHTAEAPTIREKDASLAFVTHSPIDDENYLARVNRNLETLECLEEKLVRQNGITRYEPFNFELENGEVVKSPDSYLTLGYELATTKDGKISLLIKDVKDDFGAKDCSEPDVYAARSKLSPGDDTTAQWFMVSDVSKGYGVQLDKLLEVIKKENRKPSDKELDLIKKIYKKETEYINRAYARVTGQNDDGSPLTKANGKACPVFKVPEAFMAVPTLDGKVNFLPGTNTPLAWAQTSLYGASKQYASNLEKLEKLHLLSTVQ